MFRKAVFRRGIEFTVFAKENEIEWLEQYFQAEFVRWMDSPLQTLK